MNPVKILLIVPNESVIGACEAFLTQVDAPVQVLTQLPKPIELLHQGNGVVCCVIGNQFDPDNLPFQALRQDYFHYVASIEAVANGFRCEVIKNSEGFRGIRETLIANDFSNLIDVMDCMRLNHRQ